MYDIIIGRLDSDREKFGSAGTIFLGKHYVKMGQRTSLSNKVYMDMNRSHVVFIVGKRGGGKCLAGDALVSLENGSEVPIENLVSDARKILAINHNLKLTSVKKEGFYRREVNSVLKMNLKSGKHITLTPEHPLLTMSGWIPAEYLEAGSYIATPKKGGDIELIKKIGSISHQNCSTQRQHLIQQVISKERLECLEKADIFWDEIVSIEKIQEKTTVYDISVPELHNFVANGIIVHNSYTMGVIAEGMADLPPEIKNNISIILLDTMGIYWTMRYPNHKDKDLLDQWGLPLKPLDVTIYTPTGYYQEYKDKGIPTDHPFSIKPSELDARDWQLAFELNNNDPVNVLMERIIHDLKERGKDYDIPDIIKEIDKDKDFDGTIRAAVKNRFLNAQNWGVFDKNGTPISELAKGGQVTVLDVSAYATIPGSWGIKSLVVGVVAQKLFIQRMVNRLEEEFKDINAKISFISEEGEEKQAFPLVWLVVDEAHEFLPREGRTAATDPLVTILREGRQPGISLVLATQQPAKIHTDVATQSDILISHRITAKIDTDALGALMQSYLREGLDKLLDDLPREKGAALILDDSNEKVFPIKIRPRFTWHGGDAPTAIKKKEKLF
ncbi:MAG TPA: DUF87 domain-containing protein [Candidatus Nanoarchaeia archaeon]|nr:DUF87 domain-containing protein [Candidatus Nanoarchaeia archaeon]